MGIPLCVICCFSLAAFNICSLCLIFVNLINMCFGILNSFALQPHPQRGNSTIKNIQIIGVPEEEYKKKGHEKILEKKIVENFPKMGKEIATQVQETQRVPNRINPGKTLQDTY